MEKERKQPTTRALYLTTVATMMTHFQYECIDTTDLPFREKQIYGLSKNSLNYI